VDEFSEGKPRGRAIQCGADSEASAADHLCSGVGVGLGYLYFIKTPDLSIGVTMLVRTSPESGSTISGSRSKSPYGRARPHAQLITSPCRGKSTDSELGAARIRHDGYVIFHTSRDLETPPLYRLSAQSHAANRQMKVAILSI